METLLQRSLIAHLHNALIQAVVLPFWVWLRKVMMLLPGPRSFVSLAIWIPIDSQHYLLKYANPNDTLDQPCKRMYWPSTVQGRSLHWLIEHGPNQWALRLLVVVEHSLQTTRASQC